MAVASQTELSQIAPVFWRVATAGASRSQTARETSAVYSFLQAKSANAAARHSAAGYRPSIEHPGYVHRLLSGATLYVPFHLLDLLPQDDIFLPASSLAAGMRLDPRGSICLSGSITLCGVLSDIADLDLCEYYVGDPDDLAPRIVEKVRRAGLPAVVRVQIGDSSFAYPWKRLPESIRRRLAAGKAHYKPADRAMLYGLHASAQFGALPVTSKILPIDSDHPDEGHARKSFTYQELVITAAAAPPRGLVQPHQVGQYLEFLVSEADRNLVNRPLKALKRILSFACLVEGRQIEADAIALLASPAALVVTRDARHSAYDRLYRKASKRVRRLLDLELPALAKAPTSYKMDSGSVGEVRRLATDLSQELLIEVRAMMRAMRAGQGAAPQ